eukprot:TRINITY_DN4497_c1_g1_i2.p2 TRINITY_DN4497_c1_g1~~TRINITY_DN4497_c1_g1_i2.p2  ORF type:complete len:140 (+),score=30.83 TRINITY_DN4497_c1_g1_i2:182-601(+)
MPLDAPGGFFRVAAPFLPDPPPPPLVSIMHRNLHRATTATETATKVIEAGYIKGEALASQLKVKAKQYDEKYEVSARSKGVVKTVSSVVTGAGNKVKSVVGGVAGKKDARGPTEEEQRQFQDGGVRSWDQKAVSSQPQW